MIDLALHQIAQIGIFNKREPALAQQVVSEDWIDIPAAPGQPFG
jgi:hypothetical protein